MKKNQKKSTITDVAKYVGMTTITVSRALNTPEKVKRETLERILAAASELNYVPNAIARNLKSQESHIIGLIIANIDNPFYENTFKAVNHAAKESNYSLMLFDTDGSEEQEKKAIETLLSYQASGIILSAVSDDKHYMPSYLNKLKLANIPLVQIDRKIHNSDFPGVYLDNFNSAYKGMEALIKKGFKDILILAGPETSQITLNRLRGIQQAIIDQKYPIELTIKYGDYTKKPSKQAVVELIQQKSLPAAIFGLNILITLGALEAIQEAGLDTENFGFMSIDPIPFARTFGKTIPCIKHDTYALGLAAINMLIQNIQGKSKETQDIIIEGNLTIS
jgi:LacI family transcriptional regulator